MGLVQLACQCLEQRLRLQGGIGVVGRPHPLGHRPTHLLGQVVLNVPQLVDLAPRDHRGVEDLLDRCREGLGAVEDGQDRPGDIKAALAQADQQPTNQGGVLR